MNRLRGSRRHAGRVAPIGAELAAPLDVSGTHVRPAAREAIT